MDTTTLPAPAAEVIATCTAEAWTNTEQGDATTAADVAADVAQRLYAEYRVHAHCDGAPGPLQATDAPLTVWTAVIEWAEDYADQEPAVTVARNELDARRGAATHMWAMLNNISADPFVRAAMDTYGNPADADPLAWWEGMRLDCDLPGFLSVESTVVI